ncbi:T9SS type A sorting domain-containing protein [Polaribacter marinus]|uniref:T9SS type A sorting domain-containing protein n=1 Tax=Polaribacter marinus TaxID=2916838 RepID=UPI003B849CFE
MFLFYIKHTVNNITKVKLYFILRQEIKSWDLSNNNFAENKLKVNNISNAIYILKITTNKGDFSKKLLLN